MESLKDIDWFKSKVIPHIKGYDIKYKFFTEGDFGSLNQIELDSKKIGGNIDLWGLGWLGVFLWNYETEEQIMNILIAPSQKQEREEAIILLLEILKSIDDI
jgi:hypothetical protein